MGTRGPLSKKARQAAKVKAPSFAGPTAGKPEKPEKMPSPPAWLGDIACAEYRRVVREHPGLTAQDAGLLCSYAQAYGEIAVHVPALLKEGYVTSGDRGDVLNPRVRALDAARKSLLAASGALGLSPQGRARNGAGPEDATPPMNGDLPGQTVMGFETVNGGDSA